MRDKEPEQFNIWTLLKIVIGGLVAAVLIIYT